MKKIFLYIVLSLVLFIIGFVFFDVFFEISIKQIKTNNFNIDSIVVSELFALELFFAFTIALIPILYYVLYNKTKLKFIYEGLISILIIVSSGLLFWQYRIFQMNNKLAFLSKFNVNGSLVTVDVDINSFKFSIYLFIGFLIGTIISLLIFKKKDKLVLE